MDDLQNDEDLLIRFLDNDLSEEEKRSLQMRLVTDTLLQEKLTKLKVAVQAIKHFGTTEKVTGIHAQMMHEVKQEPKSKVVSINKAVLFAMAVAASVAVLFFGTRFYMNAQLSPEKVYNEAFVDFTISGSRGNNAGMSKMEMAYQQKDYSSVIGATRSLNLYPKDSLLVGLSYLHTNRLEQAISFFQKLAVTDNDYKQDAEFYLSLSYLKNQSYNKALTLMQQIAGDPSHIYHGQFTAKMIEDVKSLKEK